MSLIKMLVPGVMDDLADDIEQVRSDFDGMRGDIAAIRDLLERLVELEETQLDLIPGRRVGAEQPINTGCGKRTRK
jgi:hypothetical protein